MTYEQILVDVRDSIATITLNRPEQRNGYTWTMADELGTAFRAANVDPEVRVVVLAASGKDFCVGAELHRGKRFGPGPDDDPSMWVEPASRVTRAIFEMDKPVIAAVRGAAVGVGSTLLLPADVRLASTDTRFGFMFARRGIYPEGGSTWFLPRIVGLGRAQEWMITGRLIPAAEALEAGLVSAVHEPDEVLDKAHELAHEFVRNCAPVSVAVIRQALLRMSANDSPYPSFELDSKLIASCADNPDGVEGIASFLERRAPKFPRTVEKDLPDFLPWRQ
ncbi:enoyl-CoA hydratase-related protein [Arthrobacter sp. efr-133-TYG-118]|uniref:enoyl-CoA hydratase-related protein n=1 Tax=Arthrobacter sp. efr-133-TYG-118 TaxID=3040279 RepID=UPI00254F2796|nr:enoyl-CoA hydratase-related protein [Arthrobacter sp. efr-133-TYG-118]